MEEDRERLRRRLYRPGAGSDDLSAFLALAEPEGDEPAAEPQPRRVPRRRIAAGALAAAAVVALLVGIRAPAAPVPARPTALPSVPVAPTVRTAFADRAAAGQDAGLATWWDPTAPYSAGHGTGPGGIELPPPAGGGRITVLLVLDTDATAGWSVEHLVIHDDRTIRLASVGRARGRVRAGVPVVGRVDVTARTRPVRLDVEVPPRTRWSVAALFSDGPAVTASR